MRSDRYQPYYQDSWALVIGINRYRMASPLSFPCNDADAIASVLKEKFDFPEEQVIVLKDESATKEAILDAYIRLIDRANSLDDRVVVFFSGHGTTRRGYSGEVGYLVPVDGDPNNMASLIRWDDFTRNADLIPAKHILFIMDACYSGLALTKAIPPGTERFITDMLQRRARQVITAGKADQTVAEGGSPLGQNSIFTGYLLLALEGEAEDDNGVVTANGLMHYVYQRVSQASNSMQTPHYGHFDGDGDFVFKVPDSDLLASPQRDYIVQTPLIPEPGPSVVTPPTTKLPFSVISGYLNPADPAFGRNDWSSNLGEIRRFEGKPGEVKAYSWLALLVELVSEQTFEIDLASEVEQLPKYRPSGEKPHERFMVPERAKTTINSVVLFDPLRYSSSLWGRYLRIEKTGEMEYTDSYYTYFTYQDMRSFRYIQVIGTVWQFLHFAKDWLADHGYEAGVRFFVNLVGTKDTILTDFAAEPGEGREHWREPGSRETAWPERSLLELKCPDPNLQMQYNLVIGNLNEESSGSIIKNVAQQLGLAYNHQSAPRCFNYSTDVFPWKQFFSKRR